MVLGINSLRVQPKARAGLTPPQSLAATEPGVPSTRLRTAMRGSNFREVLIALFQPRGTLLTQLPPAEEAGEAEVEAAGMVEAALQ